MIFALVAGWSCAEAILFFIVVDVPLSAIALRQGARRAVLAAVVAAFAAVPGAAVSHRWGASDADGQRAAFLRVPGIDAALVAAARTAYIEDGWRAALRGSFSGVPFKLYAHAAGSQADPLLPFLLITPALRLPRYLLIIALTCAIARLLPVTMTPRVRLQWLSAVWLAFYGCYFTMR